MSEREVKEQQSPQATKQPESPIFDVLNLLKEPIKLPEQSAKDAFKAKLENQNTSEAGLDPIIDKGTKLVKDLDIARKASPDDKDYTQMRVSAGMNLVNAFVHAQHRDSGRSVFEKEATHELTNLLKLSPDLTKDADFRDFARMAQAQANQQFMSTLKHAFDDRINKQSDSELPGGLDPIIKKGQSLTADLDEARKLAPTDKDLVDMRVKAGVNMVRAYVYAQDGQGSTAFPKEAAEELKIIERLNPAIKNNADYKSYVEMVRGKK